MASMLVLAIFLIPLFFVETFWATFFTAALIGTGLAGFILIVDIVISDIIDEDEINTGTRREGMYFGTNAFVTRFAIALEAFSIGMIFAATSYNPYVFTQTKEFLWGLRILIAGLPILALLLAFVIIWFYPLSGRAKFKELKHELAQLHEKKGVT